MKHPLYRPLQLLPVCVLGSALIGDLPGLYRPNRRAPLGRRGRTRAMLGSAAALLYALSRADWALARAEPGRQPAGRLQTAVAIVVACFLALVLFHLGW